MLLFITSLFIFGAVGSPLKELPVRDGSAAVVDLSVDRGSPQHLASGFIYGIPDTPNQVPDHWYTDMGFNYARVGGAQLEAPARGWIWGLQEYYGRLNSTLSNYNTARKYGADVIILPHDIWGTDHANDSTVWPGDNGNWDDYDAFIKQLMSDLKANNALEGLVWDIWNEPDISIFWERSMEQWVELYVRTHKILRQDPDYDIVQISGPSLANRPLSSNTWWTSWLSAIKGNNTIPEQYSYHLEGATDSWDNDLQNTDTTLRSLLQTYGLPERQVNINEYANSGEQIPCGAAWWISRLERYGAIGLRGNWLSGTALHDLFANLLIKKANVWDYYATDYAPNGEYQVYKYYNLNMTGRRVSTTGTDDRLFDVYATIGNDKVRILSGARHTTGTWAITVNSLSAVGLPTSGTLNIQTWGFNASSVWTELDAPSDRYIASHDYEGDSVTFPIWQTDATTAWAFEFDI